MTKKSMRFRLGSCLSFTCEWCLNPQTFKKGLQNEDFSENGIVLVSKREALFLVKTVAVVHGYCHTFSA